MTTAHDAAMSMYCKSYIVLEVFKLKHITYKNEATKVCVNQCFKYMSCVLTTCLPIVYVYRDGFD